MGTEQTERVPSRADQVEAKRSTLTETHGEILQVADRLLEKAGELGWRVRGHGGGAPTDEKSAPTPVEHRFLDSAEEALGVLIQVEARLNESIINFDNYFGA
ncbi:hypothetical protein LCGC14_0394470 [marine sediment metagenome]|uniref:Uncharacterized protein n=1 Tax=marine sediment metagenome TaxID=412755 RepID=A0A0F9TGS8_9ZZZZ